MDQHEWHVYLAGFFDGEGSVTIARQRANGRSDYHHIRVGLSQTARRREVLDRAAVEFGGHVRIRRQKTRISERWAEQAVWELQEKEKVGEFLRTIQPYVFGKSEPVRIALAFLDVQQPSLTYTRDQFGRIHGRLITAEEVIKREQLRVEMQAANSLGPHGYLPSKLPPLDVQHRLATDEDGIVLMDHHPRAKLTPDQVRAIRQERAVLGTSLRLLGQKYGLSKKTVGQLLRGETYKRVLDEPPVSVT